jgi:hypothetical protein
MEDHGDADKSIWFNEYGWNAAPSSFDEDDLLWKRVSEEEQAEYALRGIELARQDWPWAGVFNIWYFRQTGQQYTPNDAAYYFRMVDVDFTPRRVYDAVQDATGTLFVAPAGHFEETNPAVASDTAWHRVIAPEASGQALLQTEVPGASLTFTFRGHAVDLIAREGPEGSRLLVTLDGRNVGSLPTDEQGRSYVDLGSALTEWQARTPIATGLGSTQHVLRLTLSEEKKGPANVDAFEVNAGQPVGFPTLPVALLSSGAALVALALVWLQRRQPRRQQYF